MKYIFNILTKPISEKGSVVILFALTLTIFLGVAAFAIDVGYHRVVRNQLQNAADAAALTLCNKLYDRDSDGDGDDDVMTFRAADPSWDIGESSEGAKAIEMNEVDNEPLVDSTITTGWWDITDPAQKILRPSSSSPRDYDGPAVTVETAKSIDNFFGTILGISTQNISATATAVAAFPGSVRPNTVIPIALEREMVDNNYNTHNDAANQFEINRLVQTSFESNVADIQGLLDKGNPKVLSIDDPIYIQTITETTLSYIQNNYADPTDQKDIIFPIAETIDGASQLIVGFIGFHIIENTDLTDLAVRGYFTTAPAYDTPGNPPKAIGTHYGPPDRCRLCQ